MRLKFVVGAFFLIALAVCFATAQAQTSTEVRSGTVVSVQGNHVVIRMSTGEEKSFDVPDDFRLTVDGKEISVHELKPGTKLTRTITTTTEPKTVYTTEVKNGTVWHVQPPTLIITGADRKNRQHTVPDWVRFESGDKRDLTIFDLKKGMLVSATIVSESQSKVVTTTPGGVSGSAPAADAPAAAPAPAADTSGDSAETLPKTASNLGLIALLGIAFLLISWKLK